MKNKTEKPKVSYTQNVETISIFGIDTSVCFHWNNSDKSNYSEKYFLRENRKSKKYRYLYRGTDNSSQYVIMAKDVELNRPIIYAIIDEVLKNSINSDSFIFYKKITEDDVWYFQASRDGMVLSGDSIVSYDDFLDILDEHVLVSDFPDDMLYVYTDKADEISSFSEVIEYGIIEIEEEVLNNLEFKIIKVSGLFGLGIGYYIFALFITSLYFLYSYIDDEIKIPEYPQSHGFKKVSELEEPIEWKMLSTIEADSFSEQVFINKYIEVIKSVPVNIVGWDVKSINYSGDKIVISYLMSKSGETTITDARPKIRSELIKSGISSDGMGFDYYAIDKTLKVIIPVDTRERVAGYESIEEYKDNMGYLKYKEEVRLLDGYKEEYKKANRDLLEHVEEMRDLPYFTRLYYLFNGRWLSDKEVMMRGASNLAKIYAKYMKKYKILPKLKPPEVNVMNKYLINIENIMDVYDYEQLHSAITFFPATSSFKDGSRKSSFKMRGIGLEMLKEKVDANKSIAPLRYKSARYDWIKSLWTIEGVLYEME